MVSSIIDIGTNTTNLLIVEHKGQDYNIIHTESSYTRLGAVGGEVSRISPEAFERGFKAIESYLALSEEHKASAVYAFGTAALRTAENSALFTQAVSELLGLDIAIISGDKEAELICKGVQLAQVLDASPSLIVDIGGGSVEFIIATEDRVLWAQSFDLGVSLLKQKFAPSDPPTQEEIATIGSYVRSELSDLFYQLDKHNITHLVGCSGSFSTYASVFKHSQPGSESTSVVALPLSFFKATLKQMVTLTSAKITSINGVNTNRVPFLPLATIILDAFVVEQFNRITYSSYALKEGVLSESILKI